MPDGLSRKYDRLYNRAGAILKRDNPCQIQHGPDGVSCLDTRRKAARGETIFRGEQLCCSGCPHLGPKGCTVKSLICKVWLCSAAAHKSPDTATALDAVGDAAHKQGVPMGFFRTPKDVALRRQYDTSRLC